MKGEFNLEHKWWHRFLPSMNMYAYRPYTFWESLCYVSRIPYWKFIRLFRDRGYYKSGLEGTYSRITDIRLWGDNERQTQTRKRA